MRLLEAGEAPSPPPGGLRERERESRAQLVARVWVEWAARRTITTMTTTWPRYRAACEDEPLSGGNASSAATNGGGHCPYYGHNCDQHMEEGSRQPSRFF